MKNFNKCLTGVILVLQIIFLPLIALSQKMWSEQREMLSKLRNSKIDSGRIHLLLKLGKYYMLRENYLYNSPDPNAHLDSAVIFADEAIRLSQFLKYKSATDEALLIKGDALIRKHEINSALALLPALKKTARFRFLVILSRNYLFHTKRTKGAVDSALSFLKQAEQIPPDQIDMEWRSERLHVKAMREFIENGLEASIKAYLVFFQQISGPGNEGREALGWHELTELVPALKKTGVNKFYCFEKMLALYKKGNFQERQAWVLKCLGDIYAVNGKLDLAENKYLESLEMYKKIGYPNVHYIYDLLAVICRNKGNFRKCNDYAMKAIASMRATNDPTAALTFYKQLGNLYRQSGQPDRSVEWYSRTLNNRLFRAGSNIFLFRNADFFARELIKINRQGEALGYILNIKARNKPNDIHASACLTASLAYCYQAVQDHNMADKYYQQLVKIANKLEKDNEITSDIFCDIGQYYIDKHQYNIAWKYLQKALRISENARLRSQTKDIQLMLYKADYGLGNYSAAIRHLLQHKLLNDSLFNETKSWQIEELKVQFETARKDKDIKLLNSQNQLQRVKAEEANRTKNVSLIFLGFTIVILALLYNRYSLKQKSNRQLEINQKELDQKNYFLETLNTEQEKLISEKEWLIKEVHHRVKNNLQMVTSLLLSQSIYLQDDTAKMAINDSLRRMQAMSLIHKKLYQHENSSKIMVSEYVKELVQYLQESFDNDSSIEFHLDIAAIDLDVSQVVPLGLIITESIVNAIKYAFPNHKKGVVSIGLTQDSHCNLVLRISDNGIGLPEGLDIQKPDSLGLDLIQGLCRQLKGAFNMSNEGGVHITVKFAVQQTEVYADIV